MFEKFKFLVEQGISEMICSEIGDYILVYGGNNFPDGPPPEGKKKIYQDMYLFDRSFNLVDKTTGNLLANGGISVGDGDKIWYILENTIYVLELVGDKIRESKFLDLNREIDSNYACKFENSLILGNKKVYHVSLTNKEVKPLSDFPGPARKQSVFHQYKDSLYVFGGASHICHLDAYKYDLAKDRWHELAEIPVSFTGSCRAMYDGDHLLIMGGFNKEVYDQAVKQLGDIDYKRQYFRQKREAFQWNQHYFLYDFTREQFIKLGKDPESATCGSGLVKIDDRFYLVGGEVQPGIRNPYIYQGKVEVNK